MFFYLTNLKNEISGRVSGYGYLNITIVQEIYLDLIRDEINWSYGMIDKYESNATLYTVRDSLAVVQRGNWSNLDAKAMILRNTGTINATIYLKTGKEAHELFQSLSNSNEEYKFNISNKDPGSCLSGNINNWLEANSTGWGTKICDVFNFRDETNEIYIDLLLTVPQDSGIIGDLSDSISLIGVPAPPN
jgi:hypothetical protein